MLKILPIALVAITLSACGVVRTVAEAVQQARATETDLEQSLGVRPSVSFHSNNGYVTVTVLFPRLLETKPLPALADAARAAIGKEFKQPPNSIVLAFALGQD